MANIDGQFVVSQDYQQETFQDNLSEVIKNAPWLGLSIIVHLLLGLIIANVDWSVHIIEQPVVIVSDPLPDTTEALIEEDQVIEDDELDIVEDRILDPTVSDDPTMDDDLQTDNPIDVHQDNVKLLNILGTGKDGGFPSYKYGKRGAAKRGGGATQQAVKHGLDWLARHQAPEGFWDCDGFDMSCRGVRCTGKGNSLNDVGVTGLALLAFLGAGNSPNEGVHKKIVKKGVKYLCDMQDPEDGCLCPKEGQTYMYNHAIACLALTEAYGLSRWIKLKKPAQKAVAFIHDSKNPGKAWRYNTGAVDPIEQNDVSVSGWMIMCLASAKDFDLLIDSADFVDALAYIDEMTDPSIGRTGYKERGSWSSRETGDELQWPFDRVETMTAVGMFSRILSGYALGEEKDPDNLLAKGAKLLRDKPPKWNEDSGTIDYYYWYYGSYAMFQMAGQNWRSWKSHMVNAIVNNQVKEGCENGSWPPQKDPWGDAGGRVYSTALCTLCLEVFYRYENLIGVR